MTRKAQGERRVGVPMAKSAPGTLFQVTDLLTLGLIVSGALALRLWQIDTIPPGLWFDEAVNAHDALKVWRGELHVFFPGNFGREALYIYALAPLVGLLGPGVVPIRLVSVGFGLSGIVGAYLLGRTLFNRPVAIASALLMALSFWHLHLSRMGFRAISLPSALAMGAFFVWYGVRAGQRWAFLVGGAFLGLSFHTYIASRAVSPLLGVLLVAVILAQPAMSRSPGGRLKVAALFLAAAVAVVAPLAAFFAVHPDLLTERTRTISYLSSEVPGGMLATWRALTRDVTGMFLFVGDVNPRHNLPGRPVFDLVGGALFLLGIFVAPQRPHRREGLFLVGWWLAGFLPLTTIVDPPHFLRAVGVQPAVYLLAGLGTWRMTTWLRQSDRAIVHRLAWPVFAAAIAASGYFTVRDYFATWATSEETYFAGQADVRVLAESLSTLPTVSGIYWGSDLYDLQPQPLTALTGQHAGVHGFDARTTLVYPPVNLGPVLYVLPRTSTDPLTPIRDLLPRSTLYRSVAGPGGSEAGWVYSATSVEFQPRPGRPLVARFGTSVELLGYDLPRTLVPGQSIPLVLYWRLLEPASRSWVWSATLVDQEHREAARTTLDRGLTGNGWRVHATLAHWMNLPTPSSPGDRLYSVRLEMAESDVGDRVSYGGVSVFDGEGQRVGTQLLLGPLRVASAPPAIPRDLVARPVRFGDRIELLGHRPLQRVIRPGEEVEVTLAWRASEPVVVPYTVFLHLIDEDGALLSQQDRPPADGQMPTTVWEPGEVVMDTLRLTVPPELGSGTARLVVGLYGPNTLQRLPVLRDGHGMGADAETLGSVMIERR